MAITSPKSILSHLNELSDIKLVAHDIAGTAANNYVYNAACPEKLRLVDCWFVKTGGAGGGAVTLTVRNGTNAITDAIDVNDADKVISVPTTIDDVYWEIAIGGTVDGFLSALNVTAGVLFLMFQRLQ